MNKTTMLFIMILSAILVSGQTKPKDVLKPLKIDEQIFIDGILDEAIWQQAPSIDAFLTFEPDLGDKMEEETIVYMMYDKENIYIAYECADSQPETIKYSVANRDDAWDDDVIAIWIDTFFDQQKAFGVWINPLGIQNDAVFTTTDFDPEYDAVLYSKGTVHDKGYTLEIKIPFKSLRYENKDVVEMGIMFLRCVRRTSESATFPPLGTSNSSSILIDMAKIEFEGIKNYTLFELIPALTLNQNGFQNSGKWNNQKVEEKISLSAKYGLTSQLILEGTYNPDFSQIESDAGQVDINLRNDLFFPEKRPFFLEGKEYFNFAAASEFDGDYPLKSLVHTRNIKEPSVGLKLTGRISGKQSVAILYAADKIPSAESQLRDSLGNHVHYSIARYKYSLGKNSYIGGIFTGMDTKVGYNRVGGLDFLYMLNESNFLKAHAFGSLKKDDITNTGGTAIGADYLLYKREIILAASLNDIGKNFHTDLGYVTRTGITRLNLSSTPRFYPDSELLQIIDLNYTLGVIRDKVYDNYESMHQFSVSAAMPRHTLLTIGYNYSNEIFSGTKFNTAGAWFNGSSQVTNQITLDLFYRYSNSIYYSDNPFQGYGNLMMFSLGYQITDQINNKIELTYADFKRDADDEQIYDYTIIRDKLIFQLSRYLFFRSIVEYNAYKKRMLTDFLISFTYIPGTVIHLGYGSVYEMIKWNGSQDNPEYINSNKYLETKRGFFFKASYLWQY